MTQDQQLSAASGRHASFEPGDDLCPPYWPRWIWWLIHHPPKGDPDPQPHPEWDRLFLNLATLQVATTLRNDEMRQMGLKGAQQALEQLGRPQG